MLSVLIKERVSGLEVKATDTDSICTTDVILEDDFFTTFAKGEDEFYSMELGY